MIRGDNLKGNPPILAMKIRTALPGDAQTISAFIQEIWRSILSEAYDENVVNLFLSFNTPERIKHSILHPQRICWVAESEEMIGFLEARIRDGGIELGRLMVRRDMRRRGIGRALMEELKKMNMPIFVDAAKHRDTVAFYKAMGFEERGEKTLTINNINVNVIEMRYEPRRRS